MISSQLAIARFRRDLTLGSALNVLLLIGVVGCVALGSAFDSRFGNVVLLTMLAGIWIALGYRSVKGSRLVAGSPQLIASGQFDLAEYQIEQALRSFSLFRTSKLLGLHHLAVLRHAQHRWSDSADLCRALLRQRLGALKGLTRQSRLVLADSLLELGDLSGSYDAISALYHEHLTLAEAVRLLGVQLDYLSRIHAWEPMLEGIATKVELSELMSTQSAARAQALLALAAMKTGRTDLSVWLRSRVELLTDAGALVEDRPLLAQLFADTSSGTSSAGPSPVE